MTDGNSNGASASAMLPSKPMSAEAERFEIQRRRANSMANSVLFPEHLRKGTHEQNFANALLVLSLAEELKENALVLAQNIYIVSGKAGWASTYLIAKANASGKFSDPIDWEVKGSGDSLEITAFATVAKTQRRVQATVSMKMAKAEGWTKNSKYNSMPEQMLRYRSATLLFRLYCPELLLGMRTADELEDIAPAPTVAHVNRVAALESRLLPQNAAAEVVDDEGEIHPAKEPTEAASLEDFK